MERYIKIRIPNNVDYRGWAESVVEYLRSKGHLIYFDTNPELIIPVWGAYGYDSMDAYHIEAYLWSSHSLNKRTISHPVG